MENTNQSMMDQEEPVLAETRKETDRKCSACGGVMDFNSAKGNMVCPYCGTEEEIEAEDPELSNQVMEAGDEHVMAPGGVVLFKLDAKAASDRFRRWIGGKFFCPKLAQESAKPKAFKGLYIPYWTFDSQTMSRYSAQFGIDRVVKDREGKTKVHTSWFRTSGHFRYSFDDILVCGSSRQNEVLLDGLEPFDTKQVAEYKPEYMAGFMAERYTVTMKDAWEQAKTRIQRILYGEVQSKIIREQHADHVQGLRLSTVHNQVTYKYLLLPVWISSFQYNGKAYHFMVNGQTGRVSGSTPISWAKVAIAAAAAIAALALIMNMTRI